MRFSREEIIAMRQPSGSRSRPWRPTPRLRAVGFLTWPPWFQGAVWVGILFLLISDSVADDQHKQDKHQKKVDSRPSPVASSPSASPGATGSPIPSPSPTSTPSSTPSASPSASPGPTPASSPTPALPPFVLDVEALASGAPVVLTRPADGLVSLNFISTVPTECQAEVKITTFTSENGSVDLDLLANRAAGRSDHSQTLPVTIKPHAILPVWLRVPPMPTAAHYNGRLIINAQGQEPVTKAISVVQPAAEQGTLVLDHTTVSRTVSTPLWPPGAGGEVVFSVVLHEKTDKIELRGISARLEGVANSPDAGFDLHQNIAFALKSPGAAKDPVPVELGVASSESDVAPRTIKAGEQAGVEVTLKDLKPGDYAATLRFTASNSTSDDAQKLQLNVHVRSCIGWAVLCLFGALVISFLSTKVLVNQQQRASLLDQIRALEPEWLSSFLPIPPVVWVRAVLHQAKQLSARYWLTSPDLIASNVNSVKNTVSVLETAHKLRVQLENNLDPLLYKAAILAMDPVIARVGTTPLSDAAMQGINADLNVFNDWLNSDKFASAFWKVLKPWVDSLLSEMGTTPIGTAVSDVHGRVNVLRSRLHSLAKGPQSLNDAETIYRNYAQLRLLWDERESDLVELVRVSKSEDLDAFFKKADQLLWDRLRKARPVTRLAEDDNTDGREAYEVLEFRVEINDPVVERSYLFRHKVVYHWKFTWTRESAGGLRGLWHAVGDKVREWFGIKDELASEYQKNRRLVGAATCCWYFPGAGSVGAFVDLHYHGTEPQHNSVSVGSSEFDIDRSGDFGRFNILRGTEVISWMIAAFIAMASGLSMFYFKGTSWGTYQDYLTLILWGIGVDQGKNFLQALQASSPQSVKPSATTPAPAPTSAPPASQ